MTYTLAHTSPARVFTTCAAINDHGAMAVAPRELRIKDGKPQDYPMWGGYLFIAATDAQWHELGRIPGFTRPHAVEAITDRVWAALRGVFDRAETSYLHQLDQWERGDVVTRLRRGDRVRIVGDVTLYGLLGDMIGTYLSGDGDQVRVQLDGLMMGKPVVRVVSAHSVAPLP